MLYNGLIILLLDNYYSNILVSRPLFGFYDPLFCQRPSLRFSFHSFDLVICIL